jgi:hypothetical protein
MATISHRIAHSGCRPVEPDPVRRLGSPSGENDPSDERTRAQGREMLMIVGFILQPADVLLVGHPTR